MPSKKLLSHPALLLFKAMADGLPPYGGPSSKLVHRRSRDDGEAYERR